MRFANAAAVVVVVDRRNFLHSIMCTADWESHLSIFLLSDEGSRIPEPGNQATRSAKRLGTDRWGGRGRGEVDSQIVRRRRTLWGMAFLALVHTESVFSVTLWYFCSVFTWYIPKLVFFFVSFRFSFCCCCCFAVFLNSRPKNCAKRSRQPVYFDLLSKCCLCQVISSSSPSSSSTPFPTICTFLILRWCVIFYT